MAGPSHGNPEHGQGPEEDPVPDIPDILKGGSPREILRRLAEDDPLEIQKRSFDVLSDLAYLVDPGQLAARTLAQIAYSAAEGSNGFKTLDEWVTNKIELSISQLIQEEREAANLGGPPDMRNPLLKLLSELTDVEPAIARRMCVVFNSLPNRMRDGFFDIVIEGCELEECAAFMETTPEALQKEVEETLNVMLDQALDWNQDGGRR